MIYLLDVSALIALLWDRHVHNSRVTKWQNTVNLAVCPLTELGFLRISTQPSFGASFLNGKKMLSDWKHAKKPKFIPCDIDGLQMDETPRSGLTTDFYLASLASRHGMRLATLDEGIHHAAAFIIPE